MSGDHGIITGRHGVNGPRSHSEAARDPGNSPVCKVAVRLTDATYTYRGGRRAPDRTIGPVTCSFGVGERAAIVGGNGSGKSTVLGLIAGAASPTRGSVAWFDGASAEHARRRIGVVFQSRALDDLLTIRETLAITGRLLGMTRGATRARLDELAARLSIGDRLDDRVGTLSGGLARRVDLARAVLHEPDLLLLDEATAGLDAESADAFNAMLDGLTGEGVTVIAATHTPEEIRRSTRVITMEAGGVISDQPADPGEKIDERGGTP